MKLIKVYLILIILILSSVFIYLNYNCKHEKTKIAVLDTGFEKKAVNSNLIHYRQIKPKLKDKEDYQA
ncbi:hypothetical protein B5P37_06345 [Staphylococcus lutrae]|uniref:Uncharacterized protein n=1 Tax=Staphylococcus lutrae TaxID=155085 RepID=A0AAC9RSN8_9STAP|nr:hypothetical protein B5P37_06345 [Staphylococcus lutrae]